MAAQILFSFEDSPGDISRTSCSWTVKSMWGWFVSSEMHRQASWQEWDHSYCHCFCDDSLDAIKLLRGDLQMFCSI